MEAVPRARELSGTSGHGSLDWVVDRVVGGLAAFHADDPVPRRSATIVEADRPTLVLGSSQRDDTVDRRVATTLGVDVVRRRSGGGAVLLMPGEFAWIDLVVPAGDPLWSDDVGEAMGWVGSKKSPGNGCRNRMVGRALPTTTGTAADRLAPWLSVTTSSTL